MAANQPLVPTPHPPNPTPSSVMPGGSTQVAPNPLTLRRLM